jgi:hypothetical protein
MDAASTGQPSLDHLHLERRSPTLPPLAVGILIAICTAKLLLHLFTSVRHYGYFRDELYYLDMARHLDWGYVDAAPLIAVYAKIALWMGGSLAALRILPALAGEPVPACDSRCAGALCCSDPRRFESSAAHLPASAG